MVGPPRPFPLIQRDPVTQQACPQAAAPHLLPFLSEGAVPRRPRSCLLLPWGLRVTGNVSRTPASADRGAAGHRLRTSPRVYTHSLRLRNLFWPLDRQLYISVPGLSSEHPPAPGTSPHGCLMSTPNSLFFHLPHHRKRDAIHSVVRAKDLGASLIPFLSSHSGEPRQLYLPVVCPAGRLPSSLPPCCLGMSSRRPRPASATLRGFLNPPGICPHSVLPWPPSLTKHSRVSFPPFIEFCPNATSSERPALSTPSNALSPFPSIVLFSTQRF